MSLRSSTIRTSIPLFDSGRADEPRVLRHAVHRGGVAASAPRTRAEAPARGRGASRARDRRRAGARAPARRRASRHQTGEHPARRWRRAGRGFRDRACVGRQGRGRDHAALHRHGHDPRHAAIHESRTSQWRGRRRPIRCLRARVRALRDARRPAAVRRLHRGRAHAFAPDGRAALGPRASRVPSAGPGGRAREESGQSSSRSLRVGGAVFGSSGDGDVGGTRAGRQRVNRPQQPPEASHPFCWPRERARGARPVSSPRRGCSRSPASADRARHASRSSSPRVPWTVTPMASGSWTSRPSPTPASSPRPSRPGCRCAKRPARPCPSSCWSTSRTSAFCWCSTTASTS